MVWRRDIGALCTPTIDPNHLLATPLPLINVALNYWINLKYIYCIYIFTLNIAKYYQLQFSSFINVIWPYFCSLVLFYDFLLQSHSTALTNTFIFPLSLPHFYRAKVDWHRSPLLLFAELDRLSHPSHGRGPRPHVCGQQRLHPLSGSARHQQGATHRKKCPTQTLNWMTSKGFTANQHCWLLFFSLSDPLARCPPEEDWVCFVGKRHQCKYSNNVI